MKGFPNQVPDLCKLADGLAIIDRLNEQGANSKSYDTLGEALVRGGVLGTGHVRQPIDQYLKEQRAKLGGPSYQSHQTGARGLREQYRMLGLIDDSASRVELTDAGRRVASFADQALDDQKRDYWRRLIRNISHPGRDGVRSHPYQVLLRLVAKRPGITRAKCALALEANDDSEEELDRIVGLSDLRESEIRTTIGETKSNWDNAKKILPKFAEQLGDVIKVKQSFYLAAGPGKGGTSDNVPVLEEELRRTRPSRSVTPDTIAVAGTAEDFDEVELPLPTVDPAAMAAAVRARRERLRRHNILVKEIAGRYAGAGFDLFEGRYDCLASGETVGILNEVKTLDGTPADEATQVRDSLGQLLYYEPFVKRETGGGIIHKVAVFEARISDDHIQIMQDLGIVCIWKEEQQFAGGPGADELLGPYFEELK
ncbi:MAG: hypothetical protein ABFD89_12930 [Bryobacteraceae bacterium]